MESRANVASLVCSLSVIALYVETIFQIYVTISTDNASIANSPRALTSLCAMCISFLSTTVVSYVTASSVVQFTSGYSKDKISFYCLHFLQFGLIWRIVRLILTFTGSDVKRMADLRLVHVALQSLPYVLIYSTTFLIRGKINTVQSFSLIVSLISSALAVTCYNLRRKLSMTGEESEETGDLKYSGRSLKTVCANLTTFLGTLLVLFARSISITLMAAQVRLWILLPLFLHFVLILIAFGAFSSRTQGQSSRTISFFKGSCYCIGLSVLSLFDLVYDNIAQVMCKYVAFYSLLLVENIIFISFWLLNFDLDYVSKLVTVVGILSGFIVGLIIKFTGINVMQRDVTKFQHDTVLCQGTLGFPSIAATATSATLTLRAPSKDSDDLISIVQASLANRTPRNDPNVLETSAKQMLNINAQPETAQKKLKKRKSKTKEQKELRNSTISNPEVSRGETRHELRNVNKKVVNLENGKAVRSNSFNVTQQDNSFQQSSALSVSDPETLLSDMMYGAGGARENQLRIGPGTRYNNDDRHGSAHDMQCRHSEPSSSRDVSRHNGQFRIDSKTFLSPPKDLSGGKSSTVSGAINRTASHLVTKGSVRKGHFKNNSCADFTHQPESSDTAMSSNKTYPYNGRREAQMNNSSSFDRRMRNILSSIDDRTFLDKLPRSLSTSETQANSNTGKMQSVHKKDRRPRANLISYTEADDVFSSSLEDGSGNMRQNTTKNKTFVSVKEKSLGSHQHCDKPSEKSPLQATGGSNSLGATQQQQQQQQRQQQQQQPQLCDSGSSSSFSTMTNPVISQTGSSPSPTSSSSPSTMTVTTEDFWHEEVGQSSDAKSDRLSQFLLQSDVSRMSPSENILRWLSTTAHNLEPP